VARHTGEAEDLRLARRTSYEQRRHSRSSSIEAN
jgi:hypothetical protein